MSSLVWFRGKELRLLDHAPLSRAASLGKVAALFVVDPYFFSPQRAENLPHRMQFLLESLTELNQSLSALGVRLLIIRGRSIQVVPSVARELGVARVLCQRWTEPFGRERDRRIQELLDVPLELLEGETLTRPGLLRSSSGRPYVTYTPFARALREQMDVPSVLALPESLQPLPVPPSLGAEPLPSLAELGLSHNPRLPSGGEQAGHLRLERFVRQGLATYATARDEMAKGATSRLSVDLKFGTISPRQIYQRVSKEEHASRFLDELLWREFSHSTLWDFPDLLQGPHRPEFLRVPWSKSEEHWAAFRAGQTGYPIVDAANRQLLGEGFVENRARMIAASFLSKHLLLPYWWGEAHYMKYLVDGDWAQNNFGWQWSAGCGVGAQPYFRVMNPVKQAEKFDPQGDYIRRYVPELERLAAPDLFAPWTAPAARLKAAGVALGRTYPSPVVEHQSARVRYLSVMKGALAARPARP